MAKIFRIVLSFLMVLTSIRLPAQQAFPGVLQESLLPGNENEVVRGVTGILQNMAGQRLELRKRKTVSDRSDIDFLVKSWSFSQLALDMPMTGIGGPGDVEVGLSSDKKEIRITLARESRSEEYLVHVIPIPEGVSAHAFSDEGRGSTLVFASNGKLMMIPMQAYDVFFNAGVPVFTIADVGAQGLSVDDIRFHKVYVDRERAREAESFRPYLDFPPDLEISASDLILTLKSNQSDEALYGVIGRSRIWESTLRSMMVLNTVLSWLGASDAEKRGNADSVKAASEFMRAHEKLVVELQAAFARISGSERNLYSIAARTFLQREGPNALKYLSPDAIGKLKDLPRDASTVEGYLSGLQDSASTKAWNSRIAKELNEMLPPYKLDQVMKNFVSASVREFKENMRPKNIFTLLQNAQQSLANVRVSKQALGASIFMGGVITMGVADGYMNDGLLVGDMLSFADMFLESLQRVPVLNLVSDRVSAFAKGAIEFKGTVVASAKDWAGMDEDFRWLKAGSVEFMNLVVIPGAFLVLAGTIKFRSLLKDAILSQKLWSIGIQIAARVSRIAELPTLLTNQKIYHSTLAQGIPAAAAEPGARGLSRVFSQGGNNPFASQQAIDAKLERLSTKHSEIHSRILPAAELFAATMVSALNHPEVDIVSLNVLTQLSAQLELMAQSGLISKQVTIETLLNDTSGIGQEELRILYERALPLVASVMIDYLSAKDTRGMSDQDFNYEVFEFAKAHQEKLLKMIQKNKNSQVSRTLQGFHRISKIFFAESLVPFVTGHKFLKYSRKFSHAVASRELTDRVNRVVPYNFVLSMIMGLLAYPGRYADAGNMIVSPDKLGDGLERTARIAKAGPVLSLAPEQLLVGASQQPTALAAVLGAEAVSDRELRSSAEKIFTKPGLSYYLSKAARKNFSDNLEEGLKSSTYLFQLANEKPVIPGTKSQGFIESFRDIKNNSTLGSFSEFYFGFLKRITGVSILGVVALTTAAQFIGFSMSSRAEFQLANVPIDHMTLWLAQSFHLSSMMATNIVVSKFLIHAYAWVIPAGQYLQGVIKRNSEAFQSVRKEALSISAKAVRLMHEHDQRSVALAESLPSNDIGNMKLQDARAELRRSVTMLIDFYQKRKLKLPEAAPSNIETASDQSLAKFIVSVLRDPTHATDVNWFTSIGLVSLGLIAGYSTFYYFFQLGGSYSIKTVWVHEGYAQAFLQSLQVLKDNVLYLVGTMLVFGKIIPDHLERSERNRVRALQGEVQGTASAKPSMIERVKERLVVSILQPVKRQAKALRDGTDPLLGDFNLKTQKNANGSIPCYTL